MISDGFHKPSFYRTALLLSVGEWHPDSRAKDAASTEAFLRLLAASAVLVTSLLLALLSLAWIHGFYPGNRIELANPSQGIAASGLHPTRRDRLP
jgi:hypothetical protein